MTVNPSLASACSAHLSPHSPALQLCMRAKQFLSCPTLCNPMDCSPPGPSVYGDSPRKYTGVGCTPSSRGYFWPRDRIYVSYISCIGRQIFFFFFLPLVPPGSPSSNPHQRIVHPAHPAWMSATPTGPELCNNHPQPSFPHPADESCPKTAWEFRISITRQGSKKSRTMASAWHWVSHKQTLKWGVVYRRLTGESSLETPL